MCRSQGVNAELFICTKVEGLIEANWILFILLHKVLPRIQIIDMRLFTISKSEKLAINKNCFRSVENESLNGDSTRK